jgi:hypothetical protein
VCTRDIYKKKNKNKNKKTKQTNPETPKPRQQIHDKVKTIGNDNKDKDSYTLGQQIIIIVKT